MNQADRNVEKAGALDTATISDALDRAGITGQCYAIRPCDPAFRLSGRAFTVRYGPASPVPGTVGDFIDDVPVGHVVVLDNSGREDATVWGDILTEIAHRRKVGGTVINGINRDKALCLELGYPVFSKGSWMRTGKDRVQVEAIGEPVNIGGVRVCPGDIVRGDADGVVVIPASVEEDILGTAERIHEAEGRIRESVRNGKSLVDARAEFNYHELQRRAERAR